MIPATVTNPTIENEITTEFNIDEIVTQEDVDAIDRSELTDIELDLLEAIELELLAAEDIKDIEDTKTPPMS